MMLEDMISRQEPTRRAVGHTVHGGTAEMAGSFEAVPAVAELDRLRPGLQDALAVGLPFPLELVVARFRSDATPIGAVGSPWMQPERRHPRDRSHIFPALTLSEGLPP
jgi:hypothetical protein